MTLGSIKLSSEFVHIDCTRLTRPPRLLTVSVFSQFRALPGFGFIFQAVASLSVIFAVSIALRLREASPR